MLPPKGSQDEQPLHGPILGSHCVPQVTAIAALSHLTTLTLLELGSNRIRVIEDISTLTELRELWLGRNRINKIDGLASLTNVRRISLQSNR